MNTLLHAMFDDRRMSVVIVSAYDDTITYYNQITGEVPDDGPPRISPDFTGRTLTELAEAWKYPLDRSPAWRCLRDSDHRMQIDHAVGTSQEGNWVVASLLNASDNADGGGEILQTVHSCELSEEQAKEAHRLIAERVAVALELEEACARRHVALASLIDADKRIDWVRARLIEMGRRHPD